MTKLNTVTMDPLIEGYLSYLDKVGRKTPRTIIDVRCTLRRAMSRAAYRTLRCGICRSKIICTGSKPSDEKGCTESSLAKYLSHLRGLPRLRLAQRPQRAQRARWLQLSTRCRGRRRSRSRWKKPSASSRQPSAAGPAARRDRLIVLLLYGCGLRTDELCSLDVAEINRERHELLGAAGQGRSAARDSRSPKRSTPNCSPIFSSTVSAARCFEPRSQEPRLRANDVCEIVRDAAARAGLRADVTPRTLRHSFATHLMDRGVDLAVIASLMGHRSPQETGVYLHVLPGSTASRRTQPVRSETAHEVVFLDRAVHSHALRGARSTPAHARCLREHPQAVPRLGARQAGGPRTRSDRGSRCARLRAAPARGARRTATPLSTAPSLCCDGSIARWLPWVISITALTRLASFPFIRAVPRKLPVSLSPEQVSRLLAEPKPDTIIGLRDRALLALLYGTGIRASECASLRNARSTSSSLTDHRAREGRSRTRDPAQP